MIDIEDLKKSVSNASSDYYLLQSITEHTYADDRGRNPSAGSVREFRAVCGIVPGDEKLVIVGSRVIIDMKTMHILDYTDGETKYVLPVSFLYKKASSDVKKAIDSFLENKKYFINGKII